MTRRQKLYLSHAVGIVLFTAVIGITVGVQFAGYWLLTILLWEVWKLLGQVKSH